MFFFQTFPTPPSDLSQFFSWFAAPETLFAFFLLYLKLPFLVNWADWKKGAVFVALATVVSGLLIGLQMILSADLISKIQPFYAPFVILLNLVLAYYGVQSLRKPIGAFWNTFIEGRKIRNDERRAAIAYMNRPMPQTESRMITPGQHG